jgi:hypothetical protein
LMPQSVTPKQCNAIGVSMLKSITIKFRHCHIAMFLRSSYSFARSSSKSTSAITPLNGIFRCHPSSP